MAWFVEWARLDSNREPGNQELGTGALVVGSCRALDLAGNPDPLISGRVKGRAW
jgi:hypothetical protein